MEQLHLIESIAYPGSNVNEDLFDMNGQAAWIFDGATGISPSIIPHSLSDPHWFVHSINDALKIAWSDNLSTPEILRAAAESVIHKFDTIVHKPLPPMIDRPTACFLMARIWKRRLELSAVGDCWMIHSSRAGVSDFGVKIGDTAEPVHKEMKRLRSLSLAGTELLARLLPFEREFRSKANQDGGHAIVDLSTRWIERMQKQDREFAVGDHILLMTDGLYRLIDGFKAYSSASLFKAAQERGLQTLYEELREREEIDKECLTYPRVKYRDDVAAAILKLG